MEEHVFVPIPVVVSVDGLDHTVINQYVEYPAKMEEHVLVLTLVVAQMDGQAQFVRYLSVHQPASMEGHVFALILVVALDLGLDHNVNNVSTSYQKTFKTDKRM
jgi:hypothetical protein